MKISVGGGEPVEEIDNYIFLVSSLTIHETKKKNTRFLS